jgi:ribosome modulation factor
MSADQDLTLREHWPTEWRDGARCAFLMKFEGAREQGGYPIGFHRWPLSRRNAWFAGFSQGFQDRMRVARVEAR